MKNIVEEKQQKFISDFNSLDDALWQNEYLLKLAGSAKKYPRESRIKDYLLRGCQSEAWLLCEAFIDSDGTGRLSIKVESDALIVKGMLQIISVLVDGEKLEDIVHAKFNFLEKTSLVNQISSDRFKGMKSAITFVQNKAKEFLQADTNMFNSMEQHADKEAIGNEAQRKDEALKIS